MDNDAVMQLKELLREKACTYRVQYTEGAGFRMSNAAQALGILSKGNQEGDTFDQDEEEENKKAKKRGRNIRL